MSQSQGCSDLPAATSGISDADIERQKLREHSLNLRRPETQRTGGANSSYAAQRGIQYLLEEAVLSMLIDEAPPAAGASANIGALRDDLRKSKLEPVRAALRRLSSVRRGQPSTFKRFWDLLDLPIAEEDPDGFDRLAELVFFTALHEMLVSVVGANAADPSEEQSNEVWGDDSDEVDEAKESEQRARTEPWPWIPERQLYQRVWQAFQLNLVDVLSNGALRPPVWLKVAVDGSADDESVYRALEERLETAYRSARSSPSVKSPGTAEAHPTGADTVNDTALVSEDPSRLTVSTWRPYAEVAEEFSAVVVQLVAELAGEDAFKWFIRRQPAWDPRALCSWVPTPTLLSKIKDLPDFTRTHPLPVNAPLIVPPKPWSVQNLDCGGYYRRRLSFYKLPDRNTQIKDFLNACIQPDLSRVLEVVNAIQETPYRINDRVWAVVRAMLDRVEALRSRRGRSRLDQPEAIDNYLRDGFAPIALAKRGTAIKEGSGDRLRRPLTLAMIEDLRTGGNDGQSVPFYFAHQADSRGRLFPVTQWLSPQGEDLSRSLLEFARGKPITPKGVRGLAIYGSQQVRYESILLDLHVADDRPPTLDERVQWVELHSDRICSYAQSPLTATAWLQTKSPFQFLAFCFVWADYLSAGSSVVSHLPVHVDGVCNGLQHIAALTGVPELAAATNLVPGRPQDIYLRLMRPAKDRLESERRNSAYAQFAIQEGLIDRDLAKTVVMIIPYGAGLKGYRKAVRRRLRDAMFPDKKSFASPHSLGTRFLSFVRERFPADADSLPGEESPGSKSVSSHLTLLSETIATAFATSLASEFSVQDNGKQVSIIDSFKKRVLSCARPVWSSGAPMTWQAPSGFLAIQRGFKATHSIVDSRLSAATFKLIDLAAATHKAKHARIKFTSARLSDTVDERAQAQAMIPNLIHSLDSAHLILSIARARTHGLSDVTVIHDSFGTHAADLPLLARSLREAFVEMHTEPTPVLTRFEQWCTVLSIAVRAPNIDVGAFSPYISLSRAEVDLYNTTAKWAGRDSTMALQLARTQLLLARDRIVTTKDGELRSKKMAEIKRLMVFAAETIELEWPSDVASFDVSQVLESEYFFS